MRQLRRYLAALLLLAPVWLGPAAVPLLRAVADVGHTCACGMALGKCGCPVCVRLEHERRHPAPAPVLRATCDDDGVTLPRGAPPVCALPGELLPGADASGAPIADLTPPSLVSRTPDGPPTPPPRA